MGDVLNIRLNLAGAKEPYNYFMLQCGPTSGVVTLTSIASCLDWWLFGGRGQERMCVYVGVGVHGCGCHICQPSHFRRDCTEFYYRIVCYLSDSEK